MIIEQIIENIFLYSDLVCNNVGWIQLIIELPTYKCLGIALHHLCCELRVILRIKHLHSSEEIYSKQGIYNMPHNNRFYQRTNR